MKNRIIYEYEIDGEYVKSYNSISAAAKYYKVDESIIRKAAKGERLTSVGKKWSFFKKDNYYDPNPIEVFANQVGIDQSKITKAKAYQTSSGETRFLIEMKNSDDSKTNIERHIVTRELKQLQRKTDELRVLKKHFRENSRVENALISLNESLINLLNKESYKPITYSHPENNNAVLIVQVTDCHFNELVTLPDNLYNFVIAAKRLQKYANKVRKIIDTYEIKNVILAFTGDLINSDRRLDEMLNMSTNRMKACLIGSRIIYHFIQDINQKANVKILSVSGNESRIKVDHGMSEIVMSDNYDFLIYNILKILFKDSQGVSFIEGDPVEQVINVNNSNILITHGTTIKDGQAAIQQVFGKYASKGILLDYAIFGHIHFTNITDIYSRSGSLVGNNIYSDRYLNFSTKASQSMHIIEKDGSIDSYKINLQYVDNYQGYDIKDDLEAYNPILTNNVKEKETIVQIVI